LWVDNYHRLNALRKYANAQKMPLKNIDPEAIDPKSSDRDRWIERIHANRHLEIGLSFLTCLLILTTICIFLTNSRSGWIAAIATVLAFAIYHRHYLVVAISASFAGCAAGAAFASDPWRSWLREIVPKAIWSRLNGEMYNSQAAELRTEIWKVAVNLTQQRPLTGWGLQSFGKIYQAQTNLWLGHPHNLVLMLTVSVGIPIALFFLSLVGWILAQGVLYLSDWHKSKRTLPTNHLIYFTYLTAFGCCTIFQATDVTIFDPRINFLGWFLLAAILGVANGNRKSYDLDPEDILHLEA
jgi:O-antigen ligase